MNGYFFPDKIQSDKFLERIQYLNQTCTLHSLQVELNGTNYTLPGSEQMQVSLLLYQLRVNFTKGERLTLRAFAVNSVGTSDPVSADVIVPCEL